ncbi:MAG: GNAT family N-acetyltransferase [Nocardioides sp.]
MDIRALDDTALADDTVMREWYDLSRRAELHGREDMPFWSFQELLGAYRSPDSGERKEMYAAYDGDLMLGTLVLWVPLEDNTEKGYLEVNVDLPHRHRGIGRALLGRAEESARADARTTLLMGTHIPFEGREEHGYVRFAEACGYSLSVYEVARQLPLPVPDDAIQGWINAAAPKHESYTIETFVGAVPDDLVESLCTIMGQLAVDAPTGAVDFEEETMTPARYAEMIVGIEAMGRARYETVALTADREVVAHSTLAMAHEGSPVVYQWGTFVHREHRGHALGLATKAVNLRAVQAARSDLTIVTTQNAETNAYMVNINERMGFRPVEVAAEFVKRL